MKAKHADIGTIQELNYLDSGARSRAVVGHLMARIARRPGRWRQRMLSRHLRTEREDCFYAEAA